MNKKVCMACGRYFENRKKWKGNWNEVKYCSNKCQKNKIPKMYMKLILELLEKRGPQSSICPSEILQLEQKSDKKLMERVRDAARLLAYEQKIIITQKNKQINPHDFKGPIRLKLKID